MQIDYPYRFDGRGRTAMASGADHVRDMVEQVLFTRPGERVNRPDYGSGLMQLVFAPLADELASATQFLVKGALEQWLGRLIAVNEVRVSREDDILRVSVSYVIQSTGEQHVEQFERTASGT